MIENGRVAGNVRKSRTKAKEFDQKTAESGLVLEQILFVDNFGRFCEEVGLFYLIIFVKAGETTCAYPLQ